MIDNILNKYNKLKIINNNNNVNFQDYINYSKDKYPIIKSIKLNIFNSIINNINNVFTLSNNNEKDNIDYCIFYNDILDSFKKSINNNNLFIIKINKDVFEKINNFNNKYDINIKIDNEFLKEYTLKDKIILNFLSDNKKHNHIYKKYEKINNVITRNLTKNYPKEIIINNINYLICNNELYAVSNINIIILN